MRILVAGWHGQIALALSEAAVRRPDVTVYAVGRPALDLTDRPSVGRGLFGIRPDVIINTAAYTDIEGAEREPQMAYRRNTVGAAALAAQAARLGVPIIHLSTVYVFDGAKHGAYHEDDAAAPINVYGASKRDGEAAVRAANPRHIILRTGWVYSPFGRNFVTSILARKRAGETLLIDDRQQGSPTYAPHLAEAVLAMAARLIAEPDMAAWGVYHVADQGTARWCDLAAAALTCGKDVGDVSKRTLPSVAAPHDGARRAPRPMNATLDCSRLADTFGIRLPHWREAVADCVARVDRDRS